MRLRYFPRFHHFLYAWASLLILGAGCASQSQNAVSSLQNHSTLLIVLDGLRPDYVTPELMPNLNALGRRGVVFNNHHSIFPTVTRVNAASIVTGDSPATHGLMGNAVFFPEVSSAKALSTGNAATLQKIESATGGRLLTAPTLGELLQQSGKKLLVVSSGSSGSAFLLNHKITGGGIINTDLILPESLRSRVEAVIGSVPPETYPNQARNQWAVDAYLEFGLKEIHPELTILWITDPDHTQHQSGVGAPKTLEAIRQVDAEIDRIVQALAERGLKNKVNIAVTSDHGFSTHTGGPDLTTLLVANKLKESRDSDDVVVAEGAIYVKNHDEAKIGAIVELLQRTEGVGPIFTHLWRTTHPEGFVPGTLSFQAIRWNHDRAADILVSADWSDATNTFGYKGTTALSGVAGHGTSSPYDIHNTLIAAGPDFKSGVTNNVPTSNADLAPTICRLLGISPSPTMTGRILKEALRGGPRPESLKVLERSYRSQTEGKAWNYEIELFESSVEGADYLDYTKVTRGK